MIEVVREEEATPDVWPQKPTGLSDAADAIPEAAVWSRIEQYITHRWQEREVVWYTTGGGLFKPRLRPVTLKKVEAWQGGDWEEITADEAPWGVLLHDCPHRLTYTAGEDTTPPDTVLLAYTRLAEYWAEAQTEVAGATSITDGDYSVTRAANAMGKALQYSGAADLLRRLR